MLCGAEGKSGDFRETSDHSSFEAQSQGIFSFYCDKLWILSNLHETCDTIKWTASFELFLD